MSDHRQLLGDLIADYIDAREALAFEHAKSTRSARACIDESIRLVELQKELNDWGLRK